VTLSVIIPTKNRKNDLLETVGALVTQTRLPDELIIVDQSASNDCGPALEQLLRNAGIARFIHIWDRTITGLPMARNVGYSACTTDIICYLDDDTTPAADYLANVEQGLKVFPEWDGICGKLSDGERVIRLRRLAGACFRLGIFRDDRAGLAMLAAPRSARLLPGAACCFRRRVLERFRFDETLIGYGLGEDIEFCLSAGKAFRFGAYPAALVHHRRSSAGRPDPLAVRTMARSSARRLWQAQRRHAGDDLCYLWLRIGFGVERFVSSRIKQPGTRLEITEPAMN
jgi:glycosyltransferase involved in cell wall biosynthesis